MPSWGSSRTPVQLRSPPPSPLCKKKPSAVGRTYVPMRKACFNLISIVSIFSIILLAGCTKKEQTVAPPGGPDTVDFVTPGTDTIMPVDYSVDPNLHGKQLAEYATVQLLAGPTTSRDAVVLFPAGTNLEV